MLSSSIDPLPPKTINVRFDPKTQEFSYSGDIDPETEEIRVQGKGLARISMILENEDAKWAEKPIKWVDSSEVELSEPPECMKTEVINSKILLIEDHCHEPSVGRHNFCVQVNHEGRVIASDPRIVNDPTGGS